MRCSPVAFATHLRLSQRACYVSTCVSHNQGLCNRQTPAAPAKELRGRADSSAGRKLQKPAVTLSEDQFCPRAEAVCDASPSQPRWSEQMRDLLTVRPSPKTPVGLLCLMAMRSQVPRRPPRDTGHHHGAQHLDRLGLTPRGPREAERSSLGAARPAAQPARPPCEVPGAEAAGGLTPAQRPQGGCCAAGDGDVVEAFSTGSGQL